MDNKKCCSKNNSNRVIGEYVCYCNKVTEEDIKISVENGAKTIQEVIKNTGAMVNANCSVNNPSGVCCYPDMLFVFNKYKKE
ncbi:MAG: (2Fe-2S)-binding protein [Clostridium sp.]